MANDLEQRVRDLERRMARVVQVGVVAAVDAAERRVTVILSDGVEHRLRFVAERAGADRAWWPPVEGEQVMVFCPDGNPAAGLVGDSLYQAEADAPADSETVRRTVMGDGAAFSYDRDASRLSIELPGDAVIEASGDVQVSAGGDVKVSAQGKAEVEASEITMNGGTGCITQQSICHFTGNPHGDGSTIVKAGK